MAHDPADEEIEARAHWARTFGAEQQNQAHKSLRRLVSSYELLERTATYWHFGEHRMVTPFRDS